MQADHAAEGDKELFIPAKTVAITLGGHENHDWARRASRLLWIAVVKL